MSQGDLFDSLRDDAPAPAPDEATPLAERMRPRDFDELLGQEELVASGSLLRDLVERDRVPSMILWGPPGCGKTSLARLIAGRTGLRFVAFSAVLSGVKQVREIVAEARYQREASRIGTILFVDEIHRFNKSQQDAFLPHVENGTIVLVGATTENPSFELNPALLSRCQVFTLKPHGPESLKAIARRALGDPGRYSLPEGIMVTEDALDALVAGSGGDARALLNRLEAMLERERRRGGLGVSEIDADHVERALADKRLRYDKSGEDHFNVMSAFHKSLRGGDSQAALHWLARMLVSGEDPMWIARRMVRFASEDVGLADPQALAQALAARDSFHFLGPPEGELALAQAAVYLASAPKSNAVYAALRAAVDDVKKGCVHEVPLYLRNASTGLMKSLGYGRGYAYPHDFDEAVADQDYLPEELKGRRYYEPSPFGFEKEIARRMAYWDELKRKLRSEGEAP